MKFTGFTDQDFETFHIDGLEERMTAIQERIQPKFKEIGEHLTADLSAMSGTEMYLHIAKHARRTVNPPKDTWMAIAANKRGYKKHPHFQLGLFDDHLFIWLAYIYELPNKSAYADKFLDHMDMIRKDIPGDYMISTDHMKKEASPLMDIDLESTLTRFKNVKKAEFLIGRHFQKNDPIVRNGDKLAEEAKETYEKLLPLYRLGFTS